MTVDSEYLKYCLKFPSGIFFSFTFFHKTLFGSKLQRIQQWFSITFIINSIISQCIKKSKASNLDHWGLASSFKVTFGLHRATDLVKFYPSSVLFYFVSFQFSTNGFPSFRQHCCLHWKVKIKWKYLGCFSLKKWFHGFLHRQSTSLRYFPWNSPLSLF